MIRLRPKVRRSGGRKTMVIQSSVGMNGANISKDLRTVQFLLCEWRFQKRLPLISIDGLFGQETLGAIRLFQKQETHIVDGRVDPKGPALKRLVSNHESVVRSFIHKHCTTVLVNLDGQLRRLAAPFPRDLQVPMNLVTTRIEALRPQVSQSTRIAAMPQLLLGFRIGTPTFGAVQAVPVVLILAIFALLFMMAIVIARPALEHLAKQLQILLNAIADAVRGIKKVLENAFRIDLPRAQRCQDPFRLAMALADEIIQDLIDISSSGERNPFVLNRIVDKLKRLERLANEFLKCMGLPPIILLGP